MRADVARLQGAWFLLTGIWPLVSPRSFQAVSGRKADMWLAQTLGALIAVVGAELLRRRVERPVFLGVASAASLGALEAAFALRGRIRRGPYLADAGLEAAFVAAWLASRSRRRDDGDS